MDSRILLPLHDMSDWECLVPHLQALARDAATEILILEAVPFTETLFEMPLAFSAHDLGIGSDTEDAEKHVAAVALFLRGLGLRARECVQIGHPTDTIADVARHQKATLIMLPVRERQGFPYSLFPTLAENVIRASPTPLYAIPAGAAQGPESQDVLIPFDGSGLSLDALPAAAQFARRGSGKLLFLHVETRGTDRERARHVLEDAMRWSNREGLPAETILTPGDPVEEILKYCAKLRPSLVAMRTRLSLTDLNGPIGSVTFQVLRAAPAPMLIVRRPARLSLKYPVLGATSLDASP